MLTFIGLGLYDERSITVEGRDALGRVDRAFAEFYTSRLVGTTVERLESYHGVDIEVRDRAGVERDPEPILAAAETGDAAFVTAGDAMISTTHVDLRLRAAERDVDTRVIQGVSAQSAASSLTGLQNYRFGKAVTLPFPHRGRRGTDRPRVPESVVDSIEANRERGLHTLVYLDIRVEDLPDGDRDADATGEARTGGAGDGDAGSSDGGAGGGRGGTGDDAGEAFMTADVAADAFADEWEDVLGVVVARAGSADPVVAADRLSALADRDFGGPLHLLVIPGDLHHVEADALRTLGGAPADAVEVV